MATATLPKFTNNFRLDERWVLVRLPIVPTCPLPRVGELNTAEAVANLYS